MKVNKLKLFRITKAFYSFLTGLFSGWWLGFILADWHYGYLEDMPFVVAIVFAAFLLAVAVALAVAVMVLDGILCFLCPGREEAKRRLKASEKREAEQCSSQS